MQKERTDPASQQPLPFMPTTGPRWRRLRAAWPLALGWREKKKYRGKENVLIQQMSLWSRQPCVSLHADSRALRHRARQPHSPACTTACSSMQQPLINSICARKRCAAPQKGETCSPRQLKGRIRHSHLKNGEQWARRDAAPKGC